MKQALLLLSCLLLVTLTLSGCWSRRELNELSIVVGVGIDKHGDKYVLSAQVVDPGSLASRNGGLTYSPAITYVTEANTINEGLRRMTTESARKMYMSHLRILVIGEAVARKGLKDVLDFFSRDHEIRSDFYVTIARGNTAQQIMHVLTPLEKIPAEKLFSSLKSSEKYWAPTRSVPLDELINSMVSAGKEAVVTGIEIKDGKGERKSLRDMQQITQTSILNFSEIGVFKKDRLVGWLDENESKGYNYVTNNVKSTVGFVSCNHHNVAAEITERQAQIIGSVKNGKPQIELNIMTEASVSELGCGVDITKEEVFQNIQNELQQKTVKIVCSSLKAAQQKYGADIFGFGQAIHRADPQAWKRLRKNWDREFRHLPIAIHVDLKLRKTGTEGSSFITDLDKEKP